MTRCVRESLSKNNNSTLQQMNIMLKDYVTQTLALDSICERTTLERLNTTNMHINNMDSSCIHMFGGPME